ncbi:MAG: hypothetical protein DRI57_00860 [Deltaproteobacteria bacterium]|nr:MAG: hypothetical protein DRI57_00860 [Deltaproteobacteria bacterium]
MQFCRPPEGGTANFCTQIFFLSESLSNPRIKENTTFFLTQRTVSLKYLLIITDSGETPASALRQSRP